jgi:hypothetical protein
MKAGDILIAKDPCVMEFEETSALIIGKEYLVESINEVNNQIVIKSEHTNVHCFSLNKNEPSYYGIFFDLKQ